MRSTTNLTDTAWFSNPNNCLKRCWTWNDPGNAPLKEYVLGLENVGNKPEDMQKISVGAIFFQDLERRCVTAMVTRAQDDGWVVGSIPGAGPAQCYRF